METKKLFTCIACRWFDKTAGNTYHSVNIVRHSNGSAVAVKMTYGYGCQYKLTALKAMLQTGFLPEKYNKNNAYLYERENDYPIIWTVSDGLKRDMVANGKL